MIDSDEEEDEFFNPFWDDDDTLDYGDIYDEDDNEDDL